MMIGSTIDSPGFLQAFSHVFDKLKNFGENYHPGIKKGGSGVNTLTHMKYMKPLTGRSAVQLHLIAFYDATVAR